MLKIGILGGGIIGLSLAVELAQRGARVIVLDRGERPASWAAAGMLAPEAEGLNGPLAGLALYSRGLWPAWATALENLSGQSVGYLASGILLPALTTNLQALQARSSRGEWLDRSVLKGRVPGISERVLGGLWFEKDGCVDNRLVLTALGAACLRLGVEVRTGVTVLGPADASVSHVLTSSGPIAADRFILTQGSWSGEWLDLPVRPLKGQMLAVRGYPGLLPTVLFGEGVYLVPRQDGRVVIGATEEWAGFRPGNTDDRIAALFGAACVLLPGLAACPLIEQWWGFRPATPDSEPILGASGLPNLYLAVGHHRNGILLAPATAKLLADQILEGDSDPLITAFAWDRFGRSGDGGLDPRCRIRGQGH